VCASRKLIATAIRFIIPMIYHLLNVINNIQHPPVYNFHIALEVKLVWLNPLLGIELGPQQTSEYAVQDPKKNSRDSFTLIMCSQQERR